MILAPMRCILSPRYFLSLPASKQLPILAALNAATLALSLLLGSDCGIQFLFLGLACIPGLVFDRDARRLVTLLTVGPILLFFATTLLPDPLAIPRGPLTPESAQSIALLWRLSVIATGLLIAGASLRFRLTAIGLHSRRDFTAAQLQELELKNRALLAAIPDPMFRLSANGLILDYRSHNEGDLFLPPSEFLGRRIMDIHPSPLLISVIADSIRLTLETEETQSFEYEHSKQGRPRFFEARLAKSGPEEVLMIARDITREKMAERELNQRRVQMVTASRLSFLGEMAGGIAHEINNPLAIIQGRASLLKDKAEAGTLQCEDATRAAEKIEATVARISRIVHALRSFARDGVGEAMEPLPLRDLIESTLELCREKFRNHAIDLQLDECTENLGVRCRKSQVSQVLLNLLSNAFDSVQDIESPRVQIGIAASSSEVEVSVMDNGKGISPEIRDRIFEPFFTTKEVGKGIGLGLSFSLGVAQGHGGSLSLDSSSSLTKFLLRLPRQDRPLT